MFGSGKASKSPPQVTLSPEAMASVAGISPLMAQSAEAALHPRIIPLGPDSVLARTHWGFYLAVPMWNVDVVPGIVRDSIIERHTTAVARDGNGQIRRRVTPELCRPSRAVGLG